MSVRSIFVVGASAGGVEALVNLYRNLPADFIGSLFIVLHTHSGGDSQLPRILNRYGTLKAVHPKDGEPLMPGTAYVARSNHHLGLEDGVVRSFVGPRRSGHRPSVDVLFESAAQTYGDLVVGVVLSGALDDGTAGLGKIKLAGGLAIAQDPREATFPSMPLSAIGNVDVDVIASSSEIGALLAQLAREDPVATLPDPKEAEVSQSDAPKPADVVDNSPAEIEKDRIYGFSCPECGGVLHEWIEGEVVQYRCHVGHRYSELALLNGHGNVLENALWTALRVLEERIEMMDRLAQRAQERGTLAVARRFESRRAESLDQADVIRGVLIGTEDKRPLIERLDETSVDLETSDEPGTGESTGRS